MGVKMADAWKNYEQEQMVTLEWIFELIVLNQTAATWSDLAVDGYSRTCHFYANLTNHTPATNAVCGLKKSLEIPHGVEVAYTEQSYKLTKRRSECTLL